MWGCGTYLGWVGFPFEAFHFEGGNWRSFGLGFDVVRRGMDGILEEQSSPCAIMWFFMTQPCN